LHGEDEDSEDEFDDLLLATLEHEQAAAHAALLGMSTVAMHVDKYFTRSEYRVVEPGLSGDEWVKRNLCNTQDCYDMYRMTPNYSTNSMICWYNCMGSHIVESHPQSRP